LEPSWVEQANLNEFGVMLRSESPVLVPVPTVRRAKVGKPPVPATVTPSDPNKPRRPWTDILLESFEKEKQREMEREAALTAQSQAQEDNENEEDEVFLDALAVTPRISPLANVNASEKQELRLLQGQKDRRGSYVEPKATTLSQDIVDEVTLKRNSWSDVPKQYDSFTSAYEAIAGPPKKIQFTPLPPPRRVKQINLEVFSTRPQTLEPIATSSSSSVSLSMPSLEPLPSPTPSRGEQELNDLIDALVREADNCGPPADQSPKPAERERESSSSPRKKRTSRHSTSSLEKESKWQAAIAEMESLSTPPPQAQTQIKTAAVSASDSINELIDTITALEQQEHEGQIHTEDGSRPRVEVLRVTELKHAETFPHEHDDEEEEKFEPDLEIEEPRRQFDLETPLSLSTEIEEPEEDRRHFDAETPNPALRTRTHTEEPEDARRHLDFDSEKPQASTSASKSSERPEAKGKKDAEDKGPGPGSPPGAVKSFEGEGTGLEWGRWTQVLLLACYILAFSQSVAGVELIPVVGILVAVFVFLASSLF
jgi:hypothetical protein